jgi:CRISPR-associated endonuclease Cas1
MAATHTLSHPSVFSQIPRSGVLVLYGFGIRASMQGGHLCIEDGLGPERRKFRLPRVGHGLRRLVVIGNDGLVSLAALRWISDQGAAFVLLERDGKVLMTTGPVRSSDARLRRAQALAAHSGIALQIARELIGRKLAGQERVVRDKLLDEKAAEVIAKYRADVDRAETMDAVRWLESQGASVYWSVWRNLPICFPKSDLLRVPDHWRFFDTRKSPLTGSQRLAANPVNAILNYLYCVLESESRLAAAALGLDPGLGFIHMDAAARDSLACDLMEPIRPEVDAWVLDWITREPLKREWFFEQRDGNCRLMASFASRLAETGPMWARAVGLIAEWVARQLWSRKKKTPQEPPPPTRITQERKRVAKGASPPPIVATGPRRHPICRGCGKEISRGSSHCPKCAAPLQTERIKAAARAALDAAHSPEARAKQAETERNRRKVQAEWSPSMQPKWLTEKVYWKKIQPALASISNSHIAKQLGISRCSASHIRSGKLRPHQRHWQPLAKSVGYSGAESTNR